MNNRNFRMPGRRLGAVTAAAALAVAPASLATAGSAHAATGTGRASAVVLRTGLDVSLLNKTVNVPLALALNEVQAPRSAERTALTARLDGVDGGRPFTVLSAAVASARATADAHRAMGSTRLVNAKVHVPGLPLLSLIEVQQVTAKATCAVGEAPAAEANVLGQVTVLGRTVTLTAGGTTKLDVPGVGDVRLDLSKRQTTSRTAAATALSLDVSVNPLKLNVADVKGSVTLAGATCRTPDAASPAPAGNDVEPQAAAGPAEGDLAETGGSSLTAYVAAGAAVMLTAGGTVVAMTRRRRS